MGHQGAEEQKVKRYVKVARRLFVAKDYTPVKDMAKEIGMDTKEFRASIARAKELLASHGYTVTNRIKKNQKDDSKTGYKRATIEEYKAEVHKSCVRAASHIHQALKLLSLLKASGKYENELEGLETILLENINSLSFPRIEQEFAEYTKLKPQFLDDIAEEEAHK